jgi:hypothetical protein
MAAKEYFPVVKIRKGAVRGGGVGGGRRIRVL